MAWLFKIEGTLVYPNEETLLVPPFKEVWERDSTEKKEAALAEFAYVEFMTSQLKSNPYRDYDGGVKELKIIEAVIHMKDWQPDELIQKCIDQVEEFQENASVNYGYYRDSKLAANKIRQFFRTFDMNERNERGLLVYKPKDITSALNDTDKVIHNLNALKKKVEQELYEETKTKAGKEISPFANPNSL